MWKYPKKFLRQSFHTAVFTQQFILCQLLFLFTTINYSCYKQTRIGFGGLRVACWTLVPKFAGSNPAKAVGFFRAEITSARLPSEGSKAVGPMS